MARNRRRKRRWRAEMPVKRRNGEWIYVLKKTVLALEGFSGNHGFLGVLCNNYGIGGYFRIWALTAAIADQEVCREITAVGFFY